MNPLTAFPPKARAVVYYVTFALGIALGALQLGYDTAAVDLPTWLVIALKVLPFLVAGFGITAASNVQVSAGTVISGPVGVKVLSATVPVSTDVSEAARTVDLTPPADPRDLDGDGRDDSTGRYV